MPWEAVLLTLNLFLEENCRTVLMLHVFLLGSILVLCVSTAGAQMRSFPDKESANILRIEKNTPDPKIKIEPVTGYPDKSSLVTNRAKTFRAYILCIPKEGGDGVCRSRVFLTDNKTGDTFMIAGEPDEAEVMRPVDGLKWLDNGRLAYERWMNPHFGRRYIINIKLQKQTGALILTDTRF
jgi:hypothetical protein